jgi:hypothetical protein
MILYPWGDDEVQSTDRRQNFANASFDGIRGVVGDTAYREYMDSADATRLRSIADAMNAALTAVRGTGYTVQQSVGLYPTSASADDYAFSRHILSPGRAKIDAFTIEFGDEFVPKFEEMREVILDVGAALTEFCRLAAAA